LKNDSGEKAQIDKKTSSSDSSPLDGPSDPILEAEESPEKIELPQPSPELSQKLESGSLRRTTKIPSLTSLKGDISSSKSSEADTTDTEDPKTEKSRNEPFELTDLEMAWKDFSSLRRKQGKAQEQHIFAQPYNLAEDGTSIIIELNNSLQMDILEEIRSDLVLFLRNKLQNDTIMVIPKVTKENGKKMLYTNKEKLDHMAEKNPLVSELQEKLGLDPDF
jgi:DNA polymerase-3 subunit gamma/tau